MQKPQIEEIVRVVEVNKITLVSSLSLSLSLSRSLDRSRSLSRSRSRTLSLSLSLSLPPSLSIIYFTHYFPTQETHHEAQSQPGQCGAIMYACFALACMLICVFSIPVCDRESPPPHLLLFRTTRCHGFVDCWHTTFLSPWPDLITYLITYLHLPPFLPQILSIIFSQQFSWQEDGSLCDPTKLETVQTASGSVITQVTILYFFTLRLHNPQRSRWYRLPL
jgi:hypothetical protein